MLSEGASRGSSCHFTFKLLKAQSTRRLRSSYPTGKHVFADISSFLKDMSLDPTHPFKSVVNISRRNPYIAVPPGTTILTVARLLAEGAAVHRVPVEKDGKIIKIISQSHILGILATVSGWRVCVS